MPMLHQVIEYNEPSYNINMCDADKTNEFYYYHSKKWCIRILLQFYQKLLKNKGRDRRINSFAE